MRFFYRVPFILSAMALMLLGLYLGLIKTGLPLVPIFDPSYHAPFMVMGFLGMVISIERIVTFRGYRWYIPPALLFIGAVTLQPLFYVLGALGTVYIYLELLRRYGVNLARGLMFASSVFFLLGNIAYYFSLEKAIALWSVYLVMVIVGERIDLSIFMGRSLLKDVSIVLLLFIFALSYYFWWKALVGLSLFLIALWSFKYDIVSRNVFITRGVTRFMAVNLLLGYLWLIITAPAWIFQWNYDLMLHGILLGFVFSMIFAHAPIIFPTILGRTRRYNPILYIPVVLFHAGLIWRFFADIRWGSLLVALSIVMYFLLFQATVFSESRAG